MIRPADRVVRSGAVEVFEAALSILQHSDGGMTKAQILDGLVKDGVDRSDATAAWDGVQRRLKKHDQVLGSWCKSVSGAARRRASMAVGL